MKSHEALKKFLYRDIDIGVWALMIKRITIYQNHLRFSEGYKYSEDIEMIYKMIALSNQVALLDNELYLYRIRNPGYLSSSGQFSWGWQ